MKIHQPCTDCGSSDALQINDNGSTFCHSCNKYTKGEQRDSRPVETAPPKEEFNMPVSKGATGIPERGIAATTMAKYGVVCSQGDIYFPYTNDTMEVCGAKVRRRERKDFFSSGDIKDGLLFGQQVFAPGSARSITLTEGEFDALAGYQLQGSQYPVVSVKSGASGALKDCKRSYEYLNSFEEIVVNFDNDEPGQKAALEICSLFAGKIRNLCLADGKDANDYLAAGWIEQYKKEWWNAPVYRPDDIVNGKDLFDEVMKPLQIPITNYPWDGLNVMTCGIRAGEIVTVVAGTGSGKSTFMKNCIGHILKRDQHIQLGVFSLEESVAMAARGIMSAGTGKNYNRLTEGEVAMHVVNDPAYVKRFPNRWPDSITREELEAAFHKVMDTGRLTFYHSGGNMTVDGVLDRLYYMAKVEGSHVIVLDHISILVGMQQVKSYGNEREAIDECMHRLRSLVESTGVTILLVCHLSRVTGGGVAHEAGGEVTLGNLRGSQAIAQLSNIAVAIERNSQAESERGRRLSNLRVLKNRFSGDTGLACPTIYDPDTGLLTETDPIDEEDAL